MASHPELLQTIAVSLGTVLEHGRIQGAREPTKGTLIVEWRAPGETHHLLISISHHVPRIYLTQKRWPNAPTPPKFLARFRKNCIGTRLQEMELDRNELRFRLVRNSAPEEAYTLSLILDGRHSAIELTSKEGWTETMKYLGPALPGPLFPADMPANGISIHRKLEACYEAHFQDTSLQQVKSQANKAMRGHLKKARRLVKKIEGDLDRAENGGSQMQWGELLKPIANQIKSGKTNVSVVDYSSPTLAEVVVPLNPALNGLENMHRYFHQGRRYKAALSQITDRYEAALLRLRELEVLAENIRESDELSRLEKLIAQHMPRRRIQQSPDSRTRKGINTPPKPYREYRSRRGSTIMIGRNAAANDRLTFGVGRGNDLWLHARGRRGAHGLIPRRGKQDIHLQCIKDAARLCAFFSEGGKTDSQIEVWIVERKHLRKPKGAPPGTVTYSGGKSVWVRHDEQETRALLNTLVEE